MMTKRSRCYDQNKRKRGSKAAAQRYYVKRVKTQQELADELKEQYEQGDISVEEYKKVLIGNQRHEFLSERPLKERLEQQMAADNEIKFQRQLEATLLELRESTTVGSLTDDA
jgi:ribosomal protein L19E